MRSTEANWPMAHVSVFSSGLGSGETGKTEDTNYEINLFFVFFINLHCGLEERVRCTHSQHDDFFVNWMQRVVKILTLREVVWAAGLVIKHRDTDVLEVFSPLCEALTLQTASPQYQLALEQALHQV